MVCGSVIATGSQELPPVCGAAARCSRGARGHRYLSAPSCSPTSKVIVGMSWRLSVSANAVAEGDQARGIRSQRSKSVECKITVLHQTLDVTQACVWHPPPRDVPCLQIDDVDGGGAGPGSGVTSQHATARPPSGTAGRRPECLLAPRRVRSSAGLRGCPRVVRGSRRLGRRRRGSRRARRSAGTRRRGVEARLVGPRVHPRSS